jgi:hypothetical protein
MVRFTSDAVAELKRRISSFDRGPYVSVSWLSAQVDLMRSADGNPEWKEVSPAQWCVCIQFVQDEALDPLADELGIQEHRKWLEEQLTSIDGLRVYFNPGSSGVTDAVVSYGDGQFDVQRDRA